MERIIEQIKFELLMLKQLPIIFRVLETINTITDWFSNPITTIGTIVGAMIFAIALYKKIKRRY